MTASPTPEQSARAILGIFKSQNCIAGDPLRTDFIKAQFLKNHGSEAEYAAGLLYAEDSDWVVISPAPDDRRQIGFSDKCESEQALRSGPQRSKALK
jgi:hypothetical protein